MSDSILVDTNVLVYAYDRAEPQKGVRAVQVLDRLATAGVGVLTTQVLAEFTVAVTRKLAAPLTIAEAYDRVLNYTQSWRVLDVTSLAVLEAIRGVRDHGFHFWDALIWASARLNQIAVVFSEDLPLSGVLEGVSFVDPFATEFQIEEWI